MMVPRRPLLRKRFLKPALAVLAASLLAVVGYSQAQQRNRAYREPEAEFHMARMVYADFSGGRVGGSRGFRGFGRPGWWAIDYPEAEYHLTRGVRRLSNVNVADDSQFIQLTDDELFDYPWLFVQQLGQGRWRPTEEETRRLREYLLRGGFLVVDDFHGEYDWQVVSSALRTIFPNRSIVDLDTSHEVFHVHYDLDQLTQIPGRRHVWGNLQGEPIVQMEGPPKWRGIYDDKGRLMVAINHNMDMGDAWEHADDPGYPEPMTALAYRFGINYLVYAMTH